MIVALEGCDNSGKSTLAAQLQANLPGSVVLHRGPPDSSSTMLEEYEHPLDAVYDIPVICDRWHLGELVYGPLLRGGSRLSSIERWHVEMYLHSRGGFIVYVDTPMHTIKERILERGDELISQNQLSLIVSAYAAVFAKRSYCPVMVVPDSGPSATNLILEVACALDERTAHLRPFETYVGAPQPRVLLLGETRGPVKRVAYKAAFVPEESTSGKFLLEALDSERWGSDDLGIANACDEDVSSLYSALGQPRVITLGKKADMIAKRERIPHEAVPHPQYMRRFHHADKTAYGNEIREKAKLSA